MSKAIINALTLALADEFEDWSDTELNVMSIGVARAFATEFVEQNAELFADLQAPPSFRLRQQNATLPPAVQTALQQDDGTRAVVHRVPVVGADGLTDVQRAAVEAGVGLCRNCQQPKNRHLPGCAVASGENPRAETKDPLPPIQ